MMIAPPPQQDSAAALQQRRKAETPSTKSAGATFPSTGAQYDSLPTDGSLPPVAAPHQQPVASIGRCPTAEPLHLRPAAKAQTGPPDDEARTEAAALCLGLTDEENSEPCSCPFTKHIADSLCLAGKSEFLKQNILLSQHFYGIGHRTAYNNVIFCEPPRQLTCLADIEGLEPAPGAWPRIECQLDPSVPENRRLWKIDRLVDFIDLKSDGSQRFVFVDWLPTGKGAQKENHKPSWVHWEQILDSTFALEFLIQWERQHLIPEILRRATAINEGHRGEATSDALGRFYRLNQWSHAQVFGSYGAVQEEIASIRQQLEASEKRNEASEKRIEELDVELQRQRCLVTGAVANYMKKEQECLALRVETARLKETNKALRKKLGIPVGNRAEALTHLKTISPLTAGVTISSVVFTDPRTTGQVFHICGVDIVVATLFFRQGNKKPLLYQSANPLWKKVDARIDGFKKQLECYNPYEDAFRSLMATWDDEDRGLLEFCLLVGIALRYILGLGAKHEQEVARTSPVTHFFGRMIPSKEKDPRDQFYKRLKSSVFLNWYYNEPFMLQEKKDLEIEVQMELEKEALAAVSRPDSPNATS